MLTDPCRHILVQPDFLVFIRLHSRRLFHRDHFVHYIFWRDILTMRPCNRVQKYTDLIKITAIIQFAISLAIQIWLHIKNPGPSVFYFDENSVIRERFNVHNVPVHDNLTTAVLLPEGDR